MLRGFTYKDDGTINKRNLILVGVGLGLLLLLSPVLFVVVATLNDFRSAPQARLTQAELEKELNEIPPFPSATSTQHNSMFKSNHGTVGNYYQADATYDQIRGYYDVELARHGWKFQKQIQLTSWGQDLGESQTFYCKGNRTADIYFTGNEQSRLGYRYALDISWGLYDCK